MKIRSHRDLETYQIAFKASMEIFELSKAFPKDEKYLSCEMISHFFKICCNAFYGFIKQSFITISQDRRIRSEDRRDRSVPIWPRLSERGNILNHLLQSFQTPKEKRLKHRSGQNMHLNVNTLKRNHSKRYSLNMTKFSVNL